MSPPPFDLNAALLPADMSGAALEDEARKIYFDDLVPNPPQTPAFAWLSQHVTTIANSEGGFRKIFGLSEKSGSGYHKTTGLCRDRMRHVHWLRPIIEMRAPKTKVYVNNHTMGEWGDKRPPRKRLFVTTGVGFEYLISQVYLEDGSLALSTAFPVKDFKWLRNTLKDRNTILMGPPFR